ncbi:AraC family transcriptional regulator [Nitrospirillum sp. BR 11163]|uniref:AraC family transcriptional regulator n=1 Tax=Nitrospirillum sp. BR 11163 TaxID=3104323 RepID=UPI002AFDD4D0|nr:AraC family transcriptional regulator [Nitrospirillum sp. BR 11163]MEA1673680.1 AraC family transcriptional regulator [Nitrospirillum sp. BR 11163]
MDLILQEKNSVAPYFVEAALGCAAAKGLDAGPLRRKAGLDGIPDGARVPVATYGTLLRLVAQVTDDEFFGLDSRRMKIGTFSVICLLALGGRDLGRALDLACRGYNSVFDGIRVGIRRQGRLACLEIRATPPQLPLALFAQETLMTYLHGLACWLVRRRIPIAAADFAHPPPPHAEEYRVLYSSTLRFGQDAARLWFDAALLALPVAQDARSAVTFLNRAPENFLVRYRNPDSYARRVTQLLDRQPPTAWPDFDTVARRLRCSPATLRRGLRQEGRPFQTIKDELRRRVAEASLAAGTEPIPELAARLGFAEPSAFHRAFRKWTDMAPGAFRAASGKYLKSASGPPASPRSPGPGPGG